MPDSFSLHELAGGVWAAVAPGMAGPAVSNAAIVDLGDKTVVVDTFMTVLAAEELAAEVRRLTGRVPYFVVNSHWHSDHVRGNRVFADVPIVGTSRMRELIIEDAPKTPQEFADRVAEMREAATKASATAETSAAQARAAATMALVDALDAEAGQYRLTLPDVLIGDRLRIEGERSADVLGWGRGHTESDLFVHLPEDGVVVAGDLVWNGIHPKTNDGFLAAWALVLERMARLEPRAVIPGHGPAGTAADIAAMADYLGAVDELLGAVRAGDVDPAQAEPPAGSEEWQEIGRLHAGLASLAVRD